MLHVGYLAFYYAHWSVPLLHVRVRPDSQPDREEYHTGILILGPLANPTESAYQDATSASVLTATITVQILMCIVLLFTSYVGTDFWSLSLGSVLPEGMQESSFPLFADSVPHLYCLFAAISGLLPPVVANALLNEGLVGVVFCIVFALLFWRYGHTHTHTPLY
jgi:hypothetical protein